MSGRRPSTSRPGAQQRAGAARRSSAQRSGDEPVAGDRGDDSGGDDSDGGGIDDAGSVVDGSTHEAANRSGARGGGWRHRSGDPISREQQPERARSIALSLLTASPRSTAQLAQLLRERGIDDDIVAEVVERYCEVGLLDDVALAAAVVRQRVDNEHRGRRDAVEQLRRRGIDDVTAAEALGRVSDEDEELAAAECARRVLRRTAGLPREVRVRRAVSAMARRGHPLDRSLRAVATELAADGAEAIDDAERFDD